MEPRQKAASLVDVSATICSGSSRGAITDRRKSLSKGLSKSRGLQNDYSSQWTPTNAFSSANCSRLDTLPTASDGRGGPLSTTAVTGRLYRIIGPTGTIYVCLTLLALLTSCLSILVDVGIFRLLQIREWIGGNSSLRYPLNLLLQVTWSGVFACLALCCIQFISFNAIGSGLPEMKSLLGGFFLKNFLSFRTMVAKALGLTLAVASGIPYGREGPFVHLASCICRQLLRLSEFRWIASNEFLCHQLYSIACVAGVTATFGAPFGGVIFSIEVTSAFYLTSNLYMAGFTATVASVVFYLFRSYSESTGVTSLFGTSFGRLPNLRAELLSSVILGFVGGALGVLYIIIVKSLLLWRIKHVVRSSQILFLTVFVSTANAVAFYYLHWVQGRSQQELVTLFFSADAKLSGFSDDSTDVLYQIALLLVVQSLMSVLASVLALPAGTFLPLFLMGAILGRFSGELVRVFGFGFSETLALKEAGYLSGVYAVIGATAVASGATQAISTAVIVFELTGQLNLLVPIMIASVVSVLLSAQFTESIYEVLRTVRRLPVIPFSAIKLSIGPETVKDVMTPLKNMRILEIGMTYENIRHFWTDKSSHHLTYPLVRSLRYPVLLGAVHREDLTRALADANAFPLPDEEIGSAERLQRIRVEFVAKGESLSASLDADSCISAEPLHMTDLRYAVDAVAPEALTEVSNAAVEPCNCQSPSIDILPIPVDETIFVLPATARLSKAHFAFLMLGASHAFVIQKGILVGVVTKDDLMQQKHSTSNGASR